MRLIDLRIAWPLQYAAETVLFDPGDYPGVAGRLGQVAGYLQATRAAVVMLARSPSDWAGQADPWRALGQLLARVEAEFAGRLLIGPADAVRCRADRNALTWGMVGVAGFDSLVRSADDLPRLASLFDRGVRVFQPIAAGPGSLAGDDGLTDLGRRFLDALLDLGPTAEPAPRPVLDLAGLPPGAVAEVVGWFAANPDRPRRVVPIATRDAAAWPDDVRARFRALGGTIGINLAEPGAADAIRAAVAGGAGSAIATDFLTADAPGFADAPSLLEWLAATFDPATAAQLASNQAADLLGRAIGLTGPL